MNNNNGQCLGFADPNAKVYIHSKMNERKQSNGYRKQLFWMQEQLGKLRRTAILIISDKDPELQQLINPE